MYLIDLSLKKQVVNWYGDGEEAVSDRNHDRKAKSLAHYFLPDLDGNSTTIIRIEQTWEYFLWQTLHQQIQISFSFAL